MLGSLGLYERTEVRDALAYLTLLQNPLDAQAFRRAIGSPRRGIGAATVTKLVAWARERHGGDLIAASVHAEELDGIRAHGARVRLAEFGAALEQIRGELAAGRSLGHVVIATVTMPGGLVRHFQHVRDHTPDPDRRRDAERVLEDLRSLCRAAQAFEEHEERATLGGLLDQAAGLHAQEIDAATDRRITVSTIHRSKGAEAQAVALLGCEEELLPVMALDLLARPRAAGRGAPAVLRRRHSRQGPAADHARRRARPATDRRPVPVPHRGRAAADAHLARRLNPRPDGDPAGRRPPIARARGRHTTNTPKEIHVQHQQQPNANPPARTHAEAAALFRRPFAPGAIGFRAMTKVPYKGAAVRGRPGRRVHRRAVGDPAAERGRARAAGASSSSRSRPSSSPPADARVYLACRLIVTLPVEEGGPDVDAVYEDLGEMDSGSFAGLKALYSDARKRAAVAAGIGAYLYTSLEAVVLPIGPHARQVQAIRRQGKPDLLVLSAETEQWLRHGYQTRMSTEAVRRDLGEMLAHGEPENGIGQGEVADQAAQPAREPPAAEPDRPGRATGTARS